MHVWRIDDEGEIFWIVAQDSDDAIKVYHEEIVDNTAAFPGESPEDLLLMVLQLPDDENFTVMGDTGEETKTCQEWAQEGRGILCGTCF